MATSGQLVKAVSDGLGVAPETVVVHMRNLREAGFITIGGRGPSAARMSARDAARLLVAVSGSNHVKESFNAATSFGSLIASQRELVSPKERSVPVSIAPHWKDGSKHWSVGYPLVADLEGDEVRSRFGLARIKTGTTFEDALTGIIEAAIANTLFPPLEPAAFKTPPFQIPDYRKRLWVTLYRPEARASITYLAEGIVYEKIVFSQSARSLTMAYKDAWESRRRATLYRQSDFNEETLAIVSDALRPEESASQVSHQSRSKRTKHRAHNQSAKAR